MLPNVVADASEAAGTAKCRYCARRVCFFIEHSVKTADFDASLRSIYTPTGIKKREMQIFESCLLSDVGLNVDERLACIEMHTRAGFGGTPPSEGWFCADNMWP